MGWWYGGWGFEMAVYLVPLWGIATFTDWFAPRRAALSMAAPTVARVVSSTSEDESDLELQ